MYGTNLSCELSSEWGMKIVAQFDQEVNAIVQPVNKTKNKSYYLLNIVAKGREEHQKRGARKYGRMNEPLCDQKPHGGVLFGGKLDKVELTQF